MNKSPFKPAVIVDNELSPSKRAIDPAQYDRQDLSWQSEGGEARTIQYWHYLQRYTHVWLGKKALDVGAGDGWFVQNMLTTGAQSALGIEPSANNRHLSRHRYPKLLIQPHTFESFVSDPESFDVITAVLSINHIADIDGFFRKCRMILSDGGQIIVVAPDFDYWRQPRRRYEINIEDIDAQHYACEVTRPSGIIADLVRHTDVYKESAKSAGIPCVDDLPMPPAEPFLKLAPHYKDADGRAITRLMRFQKPSKEVV